MRAAAGATSTSQQSLGLSEEQIQQFTEDGYLVIPGFASAEEVAALRKRAGELVESFDPDTHRRAVFSTTKQADFTDDYFYKSANNVSFFLEEKAFAEDGSLRQAKELSINKLGHAMHDVDPVFRSFSRSDKVAALLRSLGYSAPQPVQSMYIFKQPYIGGQVVPHQDSTFIYTQPMTCVGLWWALEEATKDNGCLWTLPSEHKKGLRRRFTVKDGKVMFDAPAPEYSMDEFVPLECAAGTLVLLQGENVHYSAENTSAISRHSYSMHVVESARGVAWPSDNWAHRPRNNPWTPMYK
ncbi:hypothetical protein FOA52_015654 [Chlamydomonas sp. UWO 241]|nr:hypothetical protein FOA52_015654 [Chlamydomonas sp. UWO 241]